jgi:hypothetical protein
VVVLVVSPPIMVPMRSEIKPVVMVVACRVASGDTEPSGLTGVGVGVGVAGHAAGTQTVLLGVAQTTVLVAIRIAVVKPAPIIFRIVISPECRPHDNPSHIPLIREKY